MNPSCTRVLLASLFALSASAAAHAQMPTDNLVWKQRCTLLHSMATQIDNGAAPEKLVAGTHGIASIQFATFGFDRSKATEHNVACTMFFMAAVAERAGNSPKPNPRTAHNLIVTADSEYNLANKIKVTTLQHIKRGEEEAKQVGAKAMSSEQAGAVVVAADTIPLKF